MSDEITCWCHKCHKDHYIDCGIPGIRGIPYAMTRMILCPQCGNKRCPHATDHELSCTNSNDPGQPGSIYE